MIKMVKKMDNKMEKKTDNKMEKNRNKMRIRMEI